MMVFLKEAKHVALQPACVMSQHRVTCDDLILSLVYREEEGGLLLLPAPVLQRPTAPVGQTHVFLCMEVWEGNTDPKRSARKMNFDKNSLSLSEMIAHCIR